MIKVCEVSMALESLLSLKSLIFSIRFSEGKLAAANVIEEVRC